MMLQILVVVAVALVTGANGFITCFFAGCQQGCKSKLVIGYECICNPGFSVDPNNHKKCLPVPASCFPGFEPDPANVAACRDINECARSNPCSQDCTNIPGGYVCSCRAGFHVDSTNKNRCEVDRPKCPPGYQPSFSNPTGCDDINECATNPPCAHTCHNVIGSYRCSCRSGYEVSELDKNMCSQIQICTAIQDIILVIDSSGSMGPDNNELQLQFASKFVNHFQVGNSKARFGALLFSDRVQRLFDLNTHTTTAAVAQAVRNAPYHQATTMTNEALDYIRKNAMFSTPKGGRSNAPNIAIVFTDGQSTRPDLTKIAAQKLRDESVRIVAVGIGKEVSSSELQEIASNSNDVFEVADFESLDYIEQKLSNRVCNW